MKSPLTLVMVYWGSVAQQVQLVLHCSQAWWFDPQFLLPTCQSVLGETLKVVRPAPPVVCGWMRGSVDKSASISTAIYLSCVHFVIHHEGLFWWTFITLSCSWSSGFLLVVPESVFLTPRLVNADLKPSWFWNVPLSIFTLNVSPYKWKSVFYTWKPAMTEENWESVMPWDRETKEVRLGSNMAASSCWIRFNTSAVPGPKYPKPTWTTTP